MRYLEKRHPLYFYNDKFKRDQVTDLIERLIYRVRQREEINGVASKAKAEPATEPFKAGNKLPAVEETDDHKENQEPKSQFPSLSGQIGSGFKQGGSNKKAELRNLENKAKLMFDDLDESDDEAAKTKPPATADEAVDLEFEAGSDSEDKDFNANELLNFSDYQKKRQLGNKDENESVFEQKKNLSIKDVFDDSKRQKINAVADLKDKSDDWGEEDWGGAPKVDLAKENMREKNLNKLNNDELAAFKGAMDADFSKNQLKPGDDGFVYDKVVDFSKKPGEVVDDSWDESDGKMNDDEYFDDDFDDDFN